MFRVMFIYQMQWISDDHKLREEQKHNKNSLKNMCNKIMLNPRMLEVIWNNSLI